MDDFEIELKKGFLEEATQGIADVEQCFLDLESNPHNEDTLNKIFRLAHNLKGSSRAVGFEHMGEFTHAFESFILKIKNKEILITHKVIDMLLRANDHLKNMVFTYTKDLNAHVDSSAVIDALQNFTNENQEENDLLKNNFDNNFNNSHLAISDQNTIFSNVEKIEIIDNSKKNSTQGQLGVSDQSLRVGLSKVETLIDLVGEMVILQSVLKEQLSSLENNIVTKSINQLSKVSKEIQDLAMGLRMVQIKPTFQKMVRIVRDTAHLLKKDIKIDLIGEETEIDKTILEKITDPLVHLVRNAADHGIEIPEKRLELGKPQQGTITLSAYHKSGRLIIEIKDDGGGLNAEKLKNKAIEKGIIKKDDALTEAECYQLIFSPGFSTKEVVTDISGRGVGMDVVRTNILELGGDISIESELNKGTTFRISLPLTLAIIDGMIVTVSNHRFIVPVNHVYETIKLDPKYISQKANIGDILILREEPIPIYRIGDFFGLNPSHRSIDQTIAIVNRSGTRPFALIVDDIISQGQIVVKQLSPELQGIKGVSGVTILGDGKPAFILELQEVTKRKLIKNKPLLMEVV